MTRSVFRELRRDAEKAADQFAGRWPNTLSNAPEIRPLRTILLRSRNPENIGNAKQPLWTAVGAIIWQDDILYKGTKMMYT